MSLSILKLDLGSSAWRRGRRREEDNNVVRITVVTSAEEEEKGERSYLVSRERRDPDREYLEKNQHIFRTWPFEDFESG